MLLRFSCLKKMLAMNLKFLPFRSSLLDKDLKIMGVIPARKGTLSGKKKCAYGPSLMEQTYNLIHKHKRDFKIIIPTCTEKES